MSKQEERIRKFIGKSVRFDEFGGGYIWGIDKKGNEQMIAQVRGWGAIKNLFKKEKEAAKFQDYLGTWITDAINQKLLKDE